MTQKTQGLFITFEGPDGSGKTTIINRLYDKLKSIILSKDIVLTREPGGTNNIIAEDIRNILLNKIEYKISPRTEALLFAASRAQHVHDFIKPNLEKGNIVLCDRYIFSSLVYQGIGREIGMKEVWDINQFAISGVLPDLTILVLIRPEEGIKRIKANSKRDFNRLDREEIQLHEKVYNGYLRISEEYKDQIVVVDGEKSQDEVFNDVYQIVLKKIREKYGE